MFFFITQSDSHKETEQYQCKFSRKLKFCWRKNNDSGISLQNQFAIFFLRSMKIQKFKIIYLDYIFFFKRKEWCGTLGGVFSTFNLKRVTKICQSRWHKFSPGSRDETSTWGKWTISDNLETPHAYKMLCNILLSSNPLWLCQRDLQLEHTESTNHAHSVLKFPR